MTVLVLSACKEAEEPVKTTSGPVVRVTVPGEATLQFVGQKVKTTISSVELKKQAFAGQPFSQAAPGMGFLRFKAEVRNVGSAPNSLGGGYSLRTPDGKTLEYTGVADGEDAIMFDAPLAPGDKKSGTMTWEVPTPKAGGEYVLLWRPNPLAKEQAQFVYTYKAKSS